jgi:hypothetical protein
MKSNELRQSKKWMKLREETPGLELKIKELKQLS